MFIETNLPNLLIFEPKVHQDKRGYFFESYNKNDFLNAGITKEFVQDNQSYSQFGTLRGLHFQSAQSAQAKLVRVLVGKILDVAVDLRQNSATYKQHFTVELSDTNHKQLYIPRGFAHGFIVLSKFALFAYKCDNFYNKQDESGINYADPELNIDWCVPQDKIIINNRDANLPFISQIEQEK